MGTYDWMELETLSAEIAASRTRLAAARKTRDVGRIQALEQEIGQAEARRERLLLHITTNLVAAPEPTSTRNGATEASPADAELPAAPDADGPEAADAAPADAETASVVAAEAASPAPEPTPEPEAPAPAEAPVRAVVRRPKTAADVFVPPPSEPLPEAPLGTKAAAAPSDTADAPPETPTTTKPAAAAADATAEAPPEQTAIAATLPPPEDRAVATPAAPPAPVPKARRAEGVANVWDQLKPGDIEQAKRDLDARRAEILARHAQELKDLEADRAQLDGLEQAIAGFLQKFAPSGGVVRLEDEREARQQGTG